MKITFSGNKKVEVDYKGFKILTDQREAHGGGGEAPAPFDLFLASIGSCVGYYVLDFCKKRNIPTDRTSLHLDFIRDPETRMVQNIEIMIDLPHSFPQKYKKAVVRAGELCSVKKHLVDPPNIRITVS